jgi:hypothetical protein
VYWQAKSVSGMPFSGDRPDTLVLLHSRGGLAVKNFSAFHGL